jgi:AcrR family transcriptional regulator
MARWEPDARGRLQKAALELYSERGFDETTVAEIAERAGLTERTFFRHFADKREVLFWGENTLHELLVLAVAGAPESASPIDAFAAGLKPAVTVYFENRSREQSRLRHAVIASTTALQERELIKLSRLADGVADALRRRGVTEPGASLAAEAGVAVFRVATERWTNATDGRDLVQHIDEALAELKAVVATP